MKFFLGVFFIILGFIGLTIWRKQIANAIGKIPLPLFFLYIVSSIPFIFIEESINCIDHGDGRGCTITPWIIFVLIAEILILGLIVRKINPRSIMWPLAMFSFLGALWELGFGGLRGIGPSIFLALMFLYVAVSYAFLVVIPLTVLLHAKRPKIKGASVGSMPNSI